MLYPLSYEGREGQGSAPAPTGRTSGRHGLATTGPDLAAMAEAEGFEYTVRKSGDVVVTHHGAEAAVLRGRAAERFLATVDRDPQLVMARVTGNYRRGNERTAGDHPRNRRR